MRMGIVVPIVAAAFAGLGGAAVQAAMHGPRVAVSIKPLHAIVASVMEGLATPDLIVTRAGSPHGYAMRPSEARALNRAVLVFWMGEDLEAFLRKPLAALGGETKVVALIDAPGLALLPARGGGAWDGGGERGGDALPRGAFDTHVWLDPANATAIARAAAAALGDADPANRAASAANAARFARRADDLDAEIRAVLAPVADVPFALFHDAFQYVERRYGLNAVGALTVSPDRTPGARRLRRVRARIAGSGARCLFGEPQYRPALVLTVAEGTKARTAVLDPLGVGIEPGADAYFALMRALARALRDCLAAGG